MADSRWQYDRDGIPDTLQAVVNGVVVATIDENGLAVTATGGETSRPLGDRFSDVLNAFDYTDATDSGFQMAINRAIQAGKTRSAALVVVPNRGDVLTTSAEVVLDDGVRVKGLGRPTLRLANGVNKTVVITRDYLTFTSSTPAGAPANFGFSGFFIDGNAANNAAPGTDQGHAIAVFGRDYDVDNCYLYNVHRTGGVFRYGTSGALQSPFNARIRNITTHDTGEHGIYCLDSDIHGRDFNIKNPNKRGVSAHGALLANTGHIFNLNVWGDYHHQFSLAVATTSSNCMIFGGTLENAGSHNLYVGGNNNSVIGFHAFNLSNGGISNVGVPGDGNTIIGKIDEGNVGYASSVGVQLGSSGRSPEGNSISVVADDQNGGSFFGYSSGGNNDIKIIGNQSSGTAASGTVAATDRISLNIGGSSGLVAEGLGAIPTIPGSKVVAGSSQKSQEIAFRWTGQTTDATPTEIFIDGSSLQAIMPQNSSWAWDTILLVGRTIAGGGTNRMATRFVGFANRATGGAVLASNVVNNIVTPGGWAAAISAHATSGALILTVTGEAAMTVEWTAIARIVQVTN